MQLLSFLFYSLTGFFSLKFLSHPSSRINKKLPTIKVKIIQFCPTVKIFVGDRTIHLHHWLTFTIILIITITSDAGILDTLFSKGFMVGGIFQGVTYPDWKKIIKREVNNRDILES